MQLLGLQNDSLVLRLALLKKGPSETRLEALHTIPLSNPESVKRLYKEWGKAKIATGLAAKDFILRIVPVQGAKPTLLAEAATFQAEATSHFPAQEVLAVPIYRKKGKNAGEVALFTIPKERLKNHLEEYQLYGIDPDTLSTYPSALCRFVQWKMPSLKEAVLVDLGSSAWTCVWMQEGELKKTYSIEGGTDSLLEAFAEDRKKQSISQEIEGAAKQIDLLHLKSQLNPCLSEKVLRLRQELAKVICAFQKGAPSKPILFTGQVDAFAHLPSYLLEAVAEEIEAECKTPYSLEERKAAISIGLALEGAQKHPLQLRQQEFFPEKIWRRLGLFGIGSLLLSLLLSLSLCAWSLHWSQSRKSQMVQTLQTSLEQVDPFLAQKLFQEGFSEEEALDRWFQAVQTHSRESPYLVKAPKVAQVLSWLSTHPILQELQKAKDPLQLRDFQYHLVQFPHIGSLKEPYLAKVELEFQVQEPLHARKFHEALLQGDAFVDPRLEMTWEVLSDSYRASFFLKNRSPYAS